MKRIAIFASGTGSNAAKIIDHLKQSESIEIALIVSNKSTAGVLQLAAENGIASKVISKATFNLESEFLGELEKKSIDFIVLAGFLWLVPRYLVKAFPNRIVNIHPALLPKFGGKGMFGSNVHKAVKQSGEKESGPTIHFVNEHYDEGAIIFQVKTAILETDSANDIAAKVLKLEHQYYPLIIESIVTNLP